MHLLKCEYDVPIDGARWTHFGIDSATRRRNPARRLVLRLLGKRPDRDEPATLREVLLTMAGERPTAHELMAFDDELFNTEWLHANAIRAKHLISLRLMPIDLRRMKITTAHQLRDFDFDAISLLDLTDTWLAQGADIWGADDMIAAFMASPADAVVLAGSCAKRVFGITTHRMLDVCDESTDEAVAVLEEERRAFGPAILNGVRAATLVRAGVTACALSSLGFDMVTVQNALVGCNLDEMRALGYRLHM